MADIRVEKMADLLVNYSVAVKPGDKVVIQGETSGEPLIKAVFIKVLQAGGLPYVMPSLPGIEELVYNTATKKQLQFVPEPYQAGDEHL